MQAPEGSQRKKWLPVDGKIASKSDTRSNYNDYLYMLQEKNKTLKSLRQKDSQQKELERKEQGFSVYLNGANSRSTLLPARSAVQNRRAAAKTADPSQMQHYTQQQWTDQTCLMSVGIQQSTNDETGAGAAVPRGSVSRRGWSHASVELVTQSGRRMYVRPPGIYDSDFDDGSSVEEEEKISSGEFEWEGKGEEGAEEKRQEGIEDKANPCEEENAEKEMDGVGGMGENEGRVLLEQEEEAELPFPQDSLGSDAFDSSANNNSKISAQDVDGHLGDSLEVQDDNQPVPEIEERLNEEEVELQESNNYCPDILTERTLRTVADRIRQMDGRRQRQLLEMLNKLDPSWPSGSLACNEPSIIATQDETEATARDEESTIVSTSNVDVTSRPSLNSSSSLPAWLTERAIDTFTDQQLRLSDDCCATSKSYSLPRSRSGRFTGLRAQMLSQGDQYLSSCSSRVTTGRMTGLRGQQLSRGQESLSSSSDSQLLVFSDLMDLPRLNTAVLGKGRRKIQCGSESCLVPAVDDESQDGSKEFIADEPQQADAMDETPVFARGHEARGIAQAVHGPAQGWCFDLPELPTGREILLNILNTWGDQFYVGLTGIEVFTSSGEAALVTQISADPADINVLPEYSDDPRVVQNLLDGVNRTRDDLHMWLSPFTAGKNHTIKITFAAETTIAMIRIWNYNKSRIHSYRGARDIQIFLDGVRIFEGEIARASGGMTGFDEPFGDTILFTTDENVLALVAAYDSMFPAYSGDGVATPTDDDGCDRPSTADTTSTEEEWGNVDRCYHRPLTRAAPFGIATHQKQSLVESSVVTFTFLCSWEGGDYVGLTGLELLDSADHAIPLSPAQLHASSGSEDIGRLVDGENITACREHMWLAVCSGDCVSMTISLSQPRVVGGIRVWNYNRPAEEAYRGVKLMAVRIDGQDISPEGGFLLRRGPGHDHYNFSQFISFSSLQQSLASLPEEPDYTFPCGFVFQLQLLSSWGDPYYIGLTGIELRDRRNMPIPLSPSNIATYPESVNILDGVSGDVRTPDKLIDSVCEAGDGRHMWLAPILPGVVNRVYVIFDNPQSVSSITLWNYGKTPSRGVREFALLVDNLLVHSGLLPMAPLHSVGILPNITLALPSHTFSLTKDIPTTSLAASVACKDDNSIVLSGCAPTAHAPVLRPLTSLTLADKKPRQR